MAPALVEAFEEAIRGPDHAVDLFGAAMIIARLGDPDVDPHPYARLLDDWADEVLDHAAGRRDPEDLCQAIDWQLFHVLGFHGNSTDYVDPANSYLDKVIERRTGIPITLSLVYMEVAQRVGLRCDGVGFPGHFLVRCGDPEEPIYLDPFHQGVRLDEAELLARLAALDLGGTSPYMYLCAVTRRQILQRMLTNLRAAYRERSDFQRWLMADMLALALEPWNIALYGERGMLHYRLGNFEAALADLETYAGAARAESVRSGALRLLAHLRARLGRTEESS